MPCSSYNGCYLLHSYLTCLLESESYDPVHFKAFVVKGMEKILPYKDVIKKTKLTDTDAKNLIFDLDVYMAHGQKVVHIRYACSYH